MANANIPQILPRDDDDLDDPCSWPARGMYLIARSKKKVGSLFLILPETRRRTYVLLRTAEPFMASLGTGIPHSAVHAASSSSSVVHPTCCGVARKQLGKMRGTLCYRVCLLSVVGRHAEAG